MTPRTCLWAAWAPLAALALISGARADNGEPVATPYRPTVANPAELSAPGWLEMEAGWGRVWTPGGFRWAYLAGGESVLKILASKKRRIRPAMDKPAQGRDR